MQLFRRMGSVPFRSSGPQMTADRHRPRVILVTQEGQLVGLVTVKDVLRYEAALAHRGAARPTTNATSHTRNISLDTYSGWQDAWNELEDAGRSRGLEGILEEGFAWLRIHGTRVYNRALERFRQTRGEPLERREEGNEQYSFEMVEERPSE